MYQAKNSISKVLFKEGKMGAGAQKRPPTLSTQFKASIAGHLVVHPSLCSYQPINQC
jgi:hypothetical protein